MILIDTSYLVALLNPQDQLHSRALAWTNALSEMSLVTEYVLWETVNFFSKPVNRPKVHALVEHVRTSGSYRWSPPRPPSSRRGYDYTTSGATRNGRSPTAFRSTS